jgi:tRNA uridine 5-carbamoylmethylation protein Kti12
MDVVAIFGPPAVGKATVGRELAALTGYRLLYNTLTNDLVERVFPRGHPAYSLVSEFRTRIVEEAARYGVGLITTDVWALDDAADCARMTRRQAAAEGLGARYCHVELYAPLEVRLERNRHEERVRLKERQSLTDEIMRDFDRQYRMSSGGDFPYSANYLFLDNTALTAREAANQIVRHFELPVVAG